MESLRFEVEPFGIHTTIVEPGFFRTDLLTKESTAYAALSIEDYAERTAETQPAWEAMSGKQTNDPAKLAKALITVIDQEQPPLRFLARGSGRGGGRPRPPPRGGRRCGSSPAQAPSRRSSRRPTNWSHKLTPTASCRRRSRST